MEIVDLIEEIKVKYKVSVAEIARQINVAPSTLTRYINGEREGASPRMSTLQALIDLHGGISERDAARMMRSASGYSAAPARGRLTAPARYPTPPATPTAPTGTISLPLVRHVFGQEFDPSDPGDVLDYIPISRAIARPGSYAVEVSGSAPIGSASMYLPAGAKLVIDPSRPCIPGHPVMVRYVRDEEGSVDRPASRVDARAVYLFVSHEGMDGFNYTHAGTGETHLMHGFDYDILQPVVAILYN